jgi:hypothetical protein
MSTFTIASDWEGVEVGAVIVAVVVRAVIVAVVVIANNLVL